MRSLARLAAAAIIIVGFVYVAGLMGGNAGDYTSGEPPAPAELESAVSELFAEGRCVTSAEAEEQLPQVLLGLGYADWRVETEDGVTADDCVGSALLTLDERVLLVKVLRPEVNAALIELTSYTLDHCLSFDDAIQHVNERLHQLGEIDFEIRTDGMLAAPAERWEEAQQHYEAGCAVFSGTGRDADGRRVFFVTGK